MSEQASNSERQVTMNSEQQMSVRVEGLRIAKAKSDDPLVEDVSFAIPAGEVLGLVGESGSGKTTIALSLLGYARRGLRITHGSVWLGDTNVLELDENALCRLRGLQIAYVPQDPSSGLNPSRRIGVQLREALEVHRDDLRDIPDIDARMAQVLEEVRLPATEKMLSAYPHQLSGGQQQRVAIGMAFACRPGLIVMDEPTTGLDVSTQRHILETISSLADAYDVAAVYVSHDLPVVLQVAQRAAVVYAGRIVEIGGAQQVLGSPAHPYSIGLLGAAPAADGKERLTGIEGHPPRPGSWPRGCGFAPRCKHVTDECRTALPALEPFRGQEWRVRCIRPAPPKPAGDGGSGYAEALSTGGTLRAAGLTARYGSSEVLHGVDVEVPPGVCVAVVGESGSGKTTLARCVIGMHSDWSGELTFDGRQLAKGSRERTGEQRRLMQYVFQNPYTSLNPRLRISAILDAPLRHFFNLSKSQRAARIEETLDAMSLEKGFLSRYPDQLSGGERQRIAIARALIVEPTLLICDEVTSALDVSVQAVIIDLLRKIRSTRGVSMLFITHDLALVRSIADEVMVLHDGAIVERGPVTKVLGSPDDPYTAELLADVATLQSAPAGREAQVAERQDAIAIE